MSHISLARKYRPSTFKDLLGQSGVVRVLQNALTLKRVPQSIIFSGTRGVGKTTLARLYAKALNCSDQSSVEPCNQCDSCIAIREGNHEDVFEIDGASHTGVDDIRSLQQSLDYTPQRSKFKVYIIDEVHMLSQSAFNALLKTLEEPPEHVVFLFATTELNKIPATILSRLQVFQLKKMSVGIVAQRMRDILQAENIRFEEGALTIIAKQGKGSMRDSLTMLDQAIAMGDGAVTLESLEVLTVSLPADVYLQFLHHIVKKSAHDIVSLVGTCDEKGVKWKEVIEELASYTRHAAVVRDLGKDYLSTSLLGLDATEVESLSEVARNAPLLDLNRIFRTLVKCLGELDGSNLDRFVVENYLMEWCLDPGLPMEMPEALRARHDGGARAGNNSDARGQDSGVRGGSRAPYDSGTRIINEARAHIDNEGGAPARPSTVDTTVIASAAGAPGISAKPLKKLADFQKEVKDQPFTEQTPPIVESPALEASATASSFPASWRDMVELWKKNKPLQARLLEEAYLVAYSDQKITIAVDRDSMVGSRLLKEETRKKLLEQFQLLFTFQGVLEIVARDPASADGQKVEGESLLAIREKEKEELHTKLREDAKNHPLTVEALKIFNAKVGNIEVGS
ncbi:MAG: DNA polymerase III subunit gamma/tau [Oligoflexales bacterium]